MGERVVARVWPPGAPPRRILAIRLQAMGDTVLTLPYLNALRRRLPGCELDFITRADHAELVESVELARRVFAIRGRHFRSQAMSALGLLPRLLPRRYDAVIDLQRSRISRLIRRALRPNAWSEFDRFSPRLAGERTRLTIEAIGVGPLDVVPDLELRDPDAGRSKLVDAGWTPGRDLVVLNPGGLDRGRNWPVEKFAAFAKLFAAEHVDPVKFVVLGVDKVVHKALALRKMLGDQLIDLVNQTSLREAMAIVHGARLVVSEDAGLMHVAWALGVPTVGLFGASRWVWARPHGNYGRLVLACTRPDGVCMDGTCRDATPCLERLSERRVFDAATSALQPPPGGKVIARGGVPAFHADEEDGS